jgi:hypothetical protein
MNSLLREFRLKTIKGPFEPWYCGIVEPDTERVLEKWWECPHCQMEFKTRAASLKHCLGEVGQFPATCPETKTRGKCFEGCAHE